MFEDRSALIHRTIIIEHTDAASAKVQEIVRFQATDFMEENDYVDHIFKSLYQYYLIKTKDLYAWKPSEFDFITAQVMLDVVSPGKIYHINGTTLYFNNFDIDPGTNGKYRQLYKDVNSGLVELTLSIVRYDGDMVLSTLSKDSYTEEQLFTIPRFSDLNLNHVLNYISAYFYITATPQSIFNKLIQNT